MSITLIVEPKTPPLSWREFRRTARPFSIAIDGYVAAPPRYDHKGPFLNLNHHEGVSRLETRATCAQALMAIRQGLFDRFKGDKGGPQAIVLANDCDEDVCLTWFLLSHPDLSVEVLNPVLNRLVHMEDMLDTTAGGYPFPPHLPSLQQLNWVFEPYRRFRVTGGLDRGVPEEFEGVITDVGNRIMAHITSGSESIELDTRFEVMQQEPGWSMVRETGLNARHGIFASGINAFVAVRERLDGRFAYSVGRQSLFIPFDVPRILTALSSVEGDERDGGVWGGGNTIGGSPRVRGSRLTPSQVVDIINTTIG